MPMPMLKVRNISVLRNVAQLRRCSKIGSTGQEPSSTTAAVPFGQNSRQVLGDAAPGDVGHRRRRIRLQPAA